MSNIYATHKPESAGGDGLYLKIKPDEIVKLRIATEPAIFESESKPDENNNTRLSTRYAWVVWNQDKQMAQVLQQSATFFKQLAGFAQDDDYGDPMQYDIKVKRDGEGLETTYQITPSPKKEPLPPAALEAVKNIDLIEKLEASPFSQRVAWLSDFDTNSKPVAEKPSAGPTVAQQAKAKEDSNKAAKDIFGDDEIDLSSVPF